MVISELKAASDGIGYTITQFRQGFQYAEMWSRVIVLGVLVALALLFRLVERRMLNWYYGVRAAERGPR
jgi:ABC-type nitrate/sulfonate/bicarbonate transport system permease component